MAKRAWDRVLDSIRKVTPESAEDSDAALLQRFVAHEDEAAFEELVRRHGGWVQGVCRRLLRDEQQTDDCFQATFLVLARKAPSIRKLESVGPWLFRVATRICHRARDAQIRRREIEMQKTPTTAIEPSACSQEEWQLVSDELARLPERFQAPLVLCHLQGLTNEMAASRLGCPAGSLWWRLERGREILRERLARRGLTWSAPALVAALTTTSETLRAGASAKAALKFLHGQPLEGLLSSRVVHLAEGVLRSMFLTRLCRLALGCLVLFAVAGGSVWAWRSEKPPSQAKLDAGTAVVWKQRVLSDLQEFGDVHRMALSPDGRLLAVFDDKGFRILETATGKERAKPFLKDHDNFAYHILFTPDNKSVVTLEGKGRVRIWDLEDMTKPISWNGPLDHADIAVLSPDGKMIALVGRDPRGWPADWRSPHLNDQVYLRDLKTGDDVAKIRNGKDKFVVALAFSSDSKRLWTSTASAEVAEWTIETQEKLRDLKMTPEKEEWGIVGFAPGRGYIAIASSSEQERTQSIRVIDTNTEKTVATFKTDSVHGFLPGGTRFLIGRREKDDQTLAVFDPVRDKEPQVLGNMDKRYHVGAAVSSNGKCIAVLQEYGGKGRDPGLPTIVTIWREEAEK